MQTSTRHRIDTITPNIYDEKKLVVLNSMSESSNGHQGPGIIRTIRFCSPRPLDGGPLKFRYRSNFLCGNLWMQGACLAGIRIIYILGKGRPLQIDKWIEWRPHYTSCSSYYIIRAMYLSDLHSKFFFFYWCLPPLMVRGEQSGRSTGGCNIRLDIVRTKAGSLWIPVPVRFRSVSTCCGESGHEPHTNRLI